MVRKLFLMLLIILSALLMTGSDAQPAQLAQGLPEAQKLQAIVKDGDEREFTDVVRGLIPTIVFTVPDGKTFVITDALFSQDALGGKKTLVSKIYRSTGSKTCKPDGPGFQGEDLFSVYVKPDENVVYNFVTGYEFRAGERICYLGTIGGIGTDISFSLLGDLKPVIEVSAQPSVTEQVLPPSLDTGWQISTFATLEFEDDAWNLVADNGVCNTYRSEPKGKNNPAIIVLSQLDSVTTLAYPNFGARVKVCNTTVYLPPTETGTRIRDDE